MRNPDRIPRILSLLKEVWEWHADWRLGQIIANVSPKHEANLFYTEDDELEEQLIAFKKYFVEPFR